MYRNDVKEGVLPFICLLTLVAYSSENAENLPNVNSLIYWWNRNSRLEFLVSRVYVIVEVTRFWQEFLELKVFSIRVQAENVKQFER